MPENNDDKLLDDDLAFLQEKGHEYTVDEDADGTLFIVFKAYPFGAAYSPSHADMLVILPAGYPNANVDMFFTRPDVMRVSGDWPNACQAKVQHNGQQWQQWSRHFPGWRPGIDNLRSFIAAVNKEISKGI